jgi:hypothetical protein
VVDRRFIGIKPFEEEARERKVVIRWGELRPLIRRILEDKITARQKVPRVCALWSQALFTALSPPYHDFPLARFLLELQEYDE